MSIHATNSHNNDSRLLFSEKLSSLKTILNPNNSNHSYGFQTKERGAPVDSLSRQKRSSELNTRVITNESPRQIPDRDRVLSEYTHRLKNFLGELVNRSQSAVYGPIQGNTDLKPLPPYRTTIDPYTLDALNPSLLDSLDPNIPTEYDNLSPKIPGQIPGYHSIEDFLTSTPTQYSNCNKSYPPDRTDFHCAQLYPYDDPLSEATEFLRRKSEKSWDKLVTFFENWKTRVATSPSLENISPLIDELILQITECSQKLIETAQEIVVAFTQEFGRIRYGEENRWMAASAWPDTENEAEKSAWNERWQESGRILAQNNIKDLLKWSTDLIHICELRTSTLKDWNKLVGQLKRDPQAPPNQQPESPQLQELSVPNAEAIPSVCMPDPE